MSKAPRHRPYVVFSALSVCVFGVAYYGFQIMFQVAAGGEWLTEKLYAILPFSPWQFILDCLMLSQYMLHGCMAASLTKKSQRAGTMYFIAGCILLAGLSLLAQLDSAEALAQGKWTAAALATGLLPFISLPVLMVLVIIRLVLGWHRPPRQD